MARAIIQPLQIHLLVDKGITAEETINAVNDGVPSSIKAACSPISKINVE